MGINSDCKAVTSLFLQINHRHFHCNHLKRHLNIGNFLIQEKFYDEISKNFYKKISKFQGKIQNYNVTYKCCFVDTKCFIRYIWMSYIFLFANNIINTIFNNRCWYSSLILNTKVFISVSLYRTICTSIPLTVPWSVHGL